MDKVEHYRQIVREVLAPLANLQFSDQNIINEAVSPPSVIGICSSLLDGKAPVSTSTLLLCFWTSSGAKSGYSATARRTASDMRSKPQAS